VSSILIFVASLYIYKNLTNVLKYLNEEIVNNFNSINDLLYKGLATNFQLFKPFIVISLPIIVIVLLILYSRKATEAVLVINLAVMLLFWYLDYIIEIKPFLIIFIALSIFTFAFNNHYKYLNKVKKMGVKNGVSSKNIFFSIIIFSLLIAFIGRLLPQNFQGNYTQESMERWTNPFSPDPKETIGKAKEGKYGLNTSGYSNTETNLGGPLNLNGEVVFQVKADKPLYLRGDAKEVYTGRSWTKADEKYESKWDISAEESTKFLKESLPGGVDIKTTRITIIPLKIITNTMFVPYYTSKVINGKGNVYFDPKGETFINSSKIVKEYSVEFFNPTDVENHINFISKDIMVNRSQSEQYLAYPSEISLRTKELVQNIVKNSRTNKQKVEAIQSYLSKNYPYSLEVSPIPENQEFLDYFLFTEKKGYCTYFATAMTIMCRIAGIPARYVEGFKMSEPSVDGVYDVSNKQAHAWSEVLYDSDHKLWVVKDPSSTPQEEGERIAQEEKENEITSPQDNVNNPIEEEKEKIKEPKEDDRESVGGTLKRNIDYRIIIITTIACVLAFYIIIRLILFYKRKRNFLKHKSYIPLYNYCLKRLKTIGVNKDECKTDKDFIASIGEINFSNSMNRLVDIVYEEFYGGLNSSNVDKLALYIDLEKYIKVRSNRLKYVLKKYYI
jgi:hypothetical protein